MAEIHIHRTQISLLSLSFFLQISTILLPSSSYTLPDYYFINCGSTKTVESPRRNFTGDLNPGNSGSFRFSKQLRISVEDTNRSTNTSLLYQTARLFKQRSFYEFDISVQGTYMVRLHFFPFSSPENLYAARFDVSASGFSLLSYFLAKNSTHLPVVKEFLLSISVGKFQIEFCPKASSFAFVNAIELFLAPESFIPDEAQRVNGAGKVGTFKGIPTKALRTVHRVNVGGSEIKPDGDTLFRNWVSDDNYIYNPKAAKNSKFYTLKPYRVDVSEYVAPDNVYQTAKEMNINSSVPSNNFNITWCFDVGKYSRYFVRVHFCDIVSSWRGDLVFNFYIYSNFSGEIDPDSVANRLAAPFYFDFVVDSDDSGFMNISIGPRDDSADKTAFLNGLEIMEILGESGSVVAIKRNKPKKINTFVVVASAVGVLAVIFILGFVLCFTVRRRKQKVTEILDWIPVPPHRGGSSHSKPTRTTNMTELNLGLKISLAEIQHATKNFDEKLIIGKGGFGNVFRGTLRNGMKVAVKRSKPGSGQGFPEFQTEIMVLSKIRHRHLVSLIGYCNEQSEMILIYEFMEKGTLRDHLYKSALPPLPWKQRLEICIGAARGLQYLHRGALGGFIHRDVKSTNILLNEHLVAKVADFGLSRLGGTDQTHVSTAVKGTFGYLDPDYFRTQQLTEKSDVFSFGVVLLEVLCARPAIDTSLPYEQVNLAVWGMSCKTNGTIDQIVDPSIKAQINPNSIRKFMETAEKCLQEYGIDRPTMADVLWDLEYSMQLQQTPTPKELEGSSIMTDASGLLQQLPSFQSIPFFNSSLEKDDMPILWEHPSDASASEVFSQLRIGDAR